MHYQKQYSKLQYTDLQALKQFREDIKALNFVLQQYGLALQYYPNLEQYTYLMGNHIWSVNIGPQNFNKEQNKHFEKLIASLIKAQGEDIGKEDV